MAAAFLNSWLCSPCLYQYFILIVPLAPVLLNFSLVLAVSPPCRALSWKGHHLWLVLRLRAQIAWPSGLAPALLLSLLACAHLLVAALTASWSFRSTPVCPVRLRFPSAASCAHAGPVCLALSSQCSVPTSSCFRLPATMPFHLC